MSTTTMILLILVVLVLNTVCSICFGCSRKIMARLKSQTISNSTRRLNKKMFRFLLYQVGESP